VFSVLGCGGESAAAFGPDAQDLLLDVAALVDVGELLLRHRDFEEVAEGLTRVVAPSTKPSVAYASNCVPL
jgi:hypothetical protein